MTTRPNRIVTYATILALPLGCGAQVVSANLTATDSRAIVKRSLRYFAERDERPVEAVVYKKVGNTGLQLLVCKPDGWQPGEKRPAMVWIHGGGWVAGSPKQFVPHMKCSAARGAVAFGVQYRLMKSRGYRDDKKLSDEENRRLKEEKHRAFMDGPGLRDCIADCGDAIRHIREHADELGVDTDRISVIGDSAGAYLAACLGTLAEGDARANAVIACSSISDLTTGFGPGYVKPSGDGSGKSLADDPERMARAKALSPLFNISENGTSFLILAGRNDWLKDEPKRFYEALKEGGSDCELKLYTAARHAFIVYGYTATDEQVTRAILDMDAFLVKRGLLDGPPSLAMPRDAVCVPEPPLTPPDGAGGIAFDNHGNYWTLVSGVLHVLPAQANAKWVKDDLSGLPGGTWRWVQADEFGFVWVSDGRRVLRMDPHKPDEGWFDISADPRFPDDKITAMTVAPSGAVQVTFRKRGALELDRVKDTTRIDALTETAWQRDWQLVARMPSGTHDLSGDVLNGKFYMDWAITGDLGYPSTGKFHSELLEFDPALAQWRIVADYGLPRGYCAVGALDGKIWTVAGAALNPRGERYNPTLTQLCDPATGTITRGPDLPVAIPSAIALSAGKRLYVLGLPSGKDALLKLFNIGVGEGSWTAEPDGPAGGGSSYGTELDGKLYTVVPHKYIAIFDTESKTWETTEAPHFPRSPAISHYRGEIWVMGGRTKEGGKVSYIYNPDKRLWRKGPDLPREIVWGCAFNIDGSLYMTGGQGGRCYNNRTFRLREERP